jgi:hypothetical protein
VTAADRWRRGGAGARRLPVLSGAHTARRRVRRPRRGGGRLRGVHRAAGRGAGVPVPGRRWGRRACAPRRGHEGTARAAVLGVAFEAAASRPSAVAQRRPRPTSPSLGRDAGRRDHAAVPLGRPGGRQRAV